MSGALVERGATALAPVAAPAARSAGSWVLKKGGQILATTATIGTFDSLYDWAVDAAFGPDEDDQAELIQELYQTRAQLDDPNVSNEEKARLAQEEASIQEELLDDYGISVMTGDPQPTGTPGTVQSFNPNVPSVAMSQPETFDADGNGQYTPAEFRKLAVMAGNLSSLLRVDMSDLPAVLEHIRVMLQFDTATLKDIIGE